jgi:hypothetical protein
VSARACPLCRTRKGKRACPAKGEPICAACCGSHRRVTIDCPDDCVFLTGAHAPGWAGRETEQRRDLRRIAPFLEHLDEPQSRLFFLTLASLHGLRTSHPKLDDYLLAEALHALRLTVETRIKGVLYEHAPADLRASDLMHDLAQLFEGRSEAGQPVAPSDGDLLAVLSGLEDALAHMRRASEGPRAFLELLARLAARLGVEARERAPAKPLIIEP